MWKYLLFFFLLSGAVAEAQMWKGLYRHHDFVCTKLEMPGYPEVLAARTCRTELGITTEYFNLKIKSPFAWEEGVHDGRVAVTLFDAAGNMIDTENCIFVFGKDRWVYYRVDLRRGVPVYDLWMTLYEHNDWGNEGGRKKTLKLNLYRLPVHRMPMNYNMQTYW